MNRRAEQGSITAVWVATLAAFFLLGLAIVEREWVNYQMRLVEQAADLAAEAGGYDHHVAVTVKATRTKTVFHQTGCVAVQGLPACVPQGYDEDLFDYPTYTGTVKEVEGARWRPLVNCDVDGWTCKDVAVADLCVEAGPLLTETVKETFRANWRERRANRLVDLWSVYQWIPKRCSPDGVAIKVDLQVDYTLRPFFGMLDMEQMLHQTGSAVIRVKPPQLTL